MIEKGLEEYHALLRDALTEGREHRQRIEEKLDRNQADLASLRKEIADDRLATHTELAETRTKIGIFGGGIGAIAGAIMGLIIKMFGS